MTYRGNRTKQLLLITLLLLSSGPAYAAWMIASEMTVAVVKGIVRVNIFYRDGDA